MSIARETSAALFKEIDGGYIFQAPNPWVFGRTRRYIVSEEQKAAILAIIVPRRPFVRIAVITIAILAWACIASTIVWALSPHKDPMTMDVVAIAVLALIPIYLAWVVALRRNLARMQPIIAEAPRTEMRIAQRELRRAMTDAISLRRALVYTAIWGASAALQTFNLVLRNGRHPLFSDAQSFLTVFVATMAALAAVYYLVIAIRKMRPCTREGSITI